MNRTSRPRRLRWWLLLVPLLAFCQSSGAAGVSRLGKGDPAPLLAEVRTALSVDESTTAPLVLLFVKKDDNFSARMIEQLIQLEVRNGDLFAESHVAVILSRINSAGNFDRSSVPENWTLVEDAEDTFYSAFRIVATPTVVVIGGLGQIAGFHAGYSPGLVRQVQRDLLLELRGTDALRTFAPPTSLQLRMARRYAERELWERSLQYYRDLAENDTLEPTDLLNMAAGLVELHEFEEASILLQQFEELDEANELRERAGRIRTRLREAKDTETP